MSYTPYHVLALIPPQVDLDFSIVIDAIRVKYSHIRVSPRIEKLDKCCVLYFENWAFRLYWEDEPHVLVESQEIAQKFPTEGIDSSLIAYCTRRITTAGDLDPDMMHFNDYVYVLEVLEAFKGIYLFDPYDGKFITE